MMTSAVVFALVCLALGTRVEAARRCEEITTCVEGMTQLHGQSGMDEVCEAGRSALACLNDALEDCRQRHPEMMPYVQPRVDELSHNMTVLCSGVGSGVSTINPGMVCDINACTPDTAKLTNQEEGCIEMRRSLTCFDDYIDNCGHQHPELIGTLQQQVDQMRSMITGHCDSGVRTTTPHMITTTLTALLTTTGHPQGMVCDINACTPDTAKLTNQEEGCIELRRSLTCFDDYIDNCGHQHPELIGSLQQQVDQMRSMITGHCDSGVSTTTPHMITTTLTALLTTTGHPQGMVCDINACAPDTAKMTNQEEGCIEMRRILPCFDDLIDNCGHQHPELVGSLQQQVDHFRSIVTDHCDSGVSTTTPHMLTTTLTALLTTTGHPQGMVCDIMACTPDHSKLTNEEEGCIEMRRSLTCFDDYINNCGHQHPEIVGSLQQQVDQMRSMITDHCGSGLSTATPNMMTTTRQPQDTPIANGKVRCFVEEEINGTLQCALGEVECEEGYEYSREDTSYSAGEDGGQCRQSIWSGDQANALMGLDNGFPLPRTPEAGWTVCLTATPTHFDRASLDFLGDNGQLFVSHFDMRMGEGMDWSFGHTVVINEAEMGWNGDWDWADQDTYHPYPYPFQQGQQFTATIVADSQHKLSYYVDGKKIASRYLQSSISEVTQVVVQGTVDISQLNVWCQ